jgi:hypothetical protein
MCRASPGVSRHHLYPFQHEPANCQLDYEAAQQKDEQKAVGPLAPPTIVSSPPDAWQARSQISDALDNFIVNVSFM